MKREALKKELEYLEKDGDEMQKLVTEDVLEVYDVLTNQGHTGFSFNYVTNLIKRLVFDDGLLRPIQPYDENTNDWICRDPEGNTYQNKRRSSVFYDKDVDRYTDVDKAVVTDDDGKSWFTTGGWVRTFEQIKPPYKPDGKRWYIHTEPTIELEQGCGADDGYYIIKKIEYR